MCIYVINTEFPRACREAGHGGTADGGNGIWPGVPQVLPDRGELVSVDHPHLAQHHSTGSVLGLGLLAVILVSIKVFTVIVLIVFFCFLLLTDLNLKSLYKLKAFLEN